MSLSLLVQSCSNTFESEASDPTEQDMSLRLLVSWLPSVLVAVCWGSWQSSAEGISWSPLCSVMLEPDACVWMLPSSSAPSPGLASHLWVGAPAMSTSKLWCPSVSCDLERLTTTQVSACSGVLKVSQRGHSSPIPLRCRRQWMTLVCRSEASS